MRRPAPQTPRAAGGRIPLIVTLTIIVASQMCQTTAFSPSSLRTNGLVHATTSRSGSPDKKSATSDLARRTARVSNFALSAQAAAAVTSTASPSNLAVSLDRPLLSPVEYAYRPPSSKGVWSSFLAVLVSDVFETALVAFLLAAGVACVPKLMSKVKATAGGYEGEEASEKWSLTSLASKLMSSVQSLLPTRQADATEAYSEPMPFDGDGGWGKCTLRSKKSVASFTVYEFALPEAYYTVPLALGQQLDFCCLSATDDICTGSFYLHHDGNTAQEAGVVRVVVPNDKEMDEGGAQFMDVLREELRPGDEVAIKPGKTRLTYHGKHTPVTDMVYLAAGLGIVPIVDQIKAITPKGASSVKVASVVWVNDNREDFDLAMDSLEAEYMKHPTKLAVSCVMDDVARNPIEGNPEMEEAVPYFNAGTMAVVSGPKRFAEKAKGYLMRKGYPENCICVLP
ncbi:hypothetical protein ACHAXT_011958 [Thalassiosira profunda]